jgi:hypothetical protein
MSTRDTFLTDFELLVGRIPATATLDQWQYAYKQVIFTMGLQILEKFQQEALGPAPQPMPWPMPAPPPMPMMEATSGGSGGAGGAGGPQPTSGPIYNRPYLPAYQPIGPIIHVAKAALEICSQCPPPQT